MSVKVILYSTSLRTWEVWSNGYPVAHGTLKQCQEYAPTALPVSDRQKMLASLSEGAGS